MRLFIAITPADSVKRSIYNIQKNLEDMSSYIRFTNVENIHITVKFLSEQPLNYLYTIKNKISEALIDMPRFEINLNRVGVFKNLEHPRVLWLGENNDQFVHLSNKIEKKLSIYRKDTNLPVRVPACRAAAQAWRTQTGKAFCHTTIGRMKYIPKKELIDSMRRVKHMLNDKMLKFNADMISLYESKLTSRGAIYKKIDSFKLGVFYG